jgi:aspartyl protease family protein
VNSLDEDFGGEKLRQSGAPSGSGKTLRFAIVMVGACVVVSLVVGWLMPELARPSAKVSMTGAAVAVAHGVPKTASNMLTYTADGSGHFFVDATVNGAPIRFLLDTGATFVALSPQDALAAGIAPGSLSFSEATNTANGVAHVARASLRSVRLGQFELGDVSAVVMEQQMPISLLGMSFLSRVNGYGIRDGVLTIEW